MILSSSASLSAPTPSRLERYAARPLPPQGAELREIVRIVQRRKWAILIATALGVLIAAVSVLLPPDRYSSTATIELNRESGSAMALGDLAGVAGGLGDAEANNMDLLTQQAVLTNDNTALRVLEDLHLESTAPFAASDFARAQQPDGEKNLPLENSPHRRERALRIFRSGLRVNLVKGTRLLTVTYTDTDPQRAAVIANALVDAYMSESTQARFQASSKASAWLTRQLADLKQHVEASQARVDAFQRSAGLTGMSTLAPDHAAAPGTAPASTDNIALARLIELNRALTTAEVSHIAKDAAFTMTEMGDPEVVLGMGSSALAGDLGSDSPVAPGSADLVLLQQLRQQLAQVQVQRATAGTKYGARNPVMTQLGNQQTTIETQIHAELERIHQRAKNDRDLAALDEAGIRRQISEQEQVVNKVTEKADQLLLLQEEAQSSRTIYQDLYTKLEEASVTAGMKASHTMLVDPARAADQPSYPRKRLTLALGTMAGLFFGLMTAFTWDYFDDSIAMPEEAEQISAMPVIGVIPEFVRKRAGKQHDALAQPVPSSDGALSPAWLLRAPRSQAAEAYRGLRTALQLSRAQQAPRVILFMSGSPEEGKSTTCLNTAAAFALQGDRVLYLDADLRRAKGHRFFACANDTGLSNCLASGLAFPAALKSYPGIDSLFLLPAGPHPPNPSELLGSKRFADLLADLRLHFDYIFIDSPPVLLVTDAQLIAPRTDGYVLVVRANKTCKRFVVRSLAMMHSTNAGVLGLVVNAFKSHSAAYSAYGYYGKGNGYYADETN